MDLVDMEASESSSEDLKTKSRRAIKAIVGKLTDLSALDALVHRYMSAHALHVVQKRFPRILRDLPARVSCLETSQKVL